MVDTSSQKCLPIESIGFTKHGVAIFNLLTLEYGNVVDGPNGETFDNCDDHPDNQGVYHYHKLSSSCVYNGNTDGFLVVAIDGISIYGPKVSWQTTNLMSSDLDDCNGKTVNKEYRYYVTHDWPYFMGCLRGEVIDTIYSARTALHRVGILMHNERAILSLLLAKILRSSKIMEYSPCAKSCKIYFEPLDIFIPWRNFGFPVTNTTDEEMYFLYVELS